MIFKVGTEKTCKNTDVLKRQRIDPIEIVVYT